LPQQFALQSKGSDCHGHATSKANPWCYKKIAVTHPVSNRGQYQVQTCLRGCSSVTDDSAAKTIAYLETPSHISNATIEHRDHNRKNNPANEKEHRQNKTT
tara:strand:- start:89449 stop:89751 length:303 start_codon:yes stop_codon:yes gene_type:complete